MALLSELVNEFIFSGLRDASSLELLEAAWEQANHKSWTDLYLDAFAFTVSDVSARSATGDPINPSRTALLDTLQADLGELALTAPLETLTTSEFVLELAAALRTPSALASPDLNLSEADYAEVLRKLVRRVEADFRSGILENTSAFHQALLDHPAGELARSDEIEQYLSMRFDLPIGQADMMEETEHAEVMSDADTQELERSAPLSLTQELTNEAAPSITSSAPLPTIPGPAIRPTGTLRVLVFAPSDVAGERQRVAPVLEKINADAAQRLSVTLALSNNPVQAFEEGAWDMAIGILWLRFDADGTTRTLGTEDDFGSAFREAQSSKGGWPRLILSRCTRAPLDILSFDTTQYARVQQFFQSIEASKSLRIPIQHFAQVDELEQQLVQQIAKWVPEFAEKEGWVLYGFGSLNEEEERWTEAIDFYDRALRVFKELALHDAATTAWESKARAEHGAKRERLKQAVARGNMARDQDSWSDADSAYQESLRLAQELDEPIQQGDLLHKLGRVAVERNQLSDALRYYDRAKEFFTAPEQRANRLEVFSHQILALEKLGDLQRAEKDFAEADKYYDRALTAARETDDASAESGILYKRGTLAEEEERWQRARENYEQAASLLVDPKQLDQRITVMQSLAAVLEKLGHASQAAENWEQAEADYRDAAAVWQTLGERTREGEVFTKLGALAESQARWDDTLEYYRRATDRLSVSAPYETIASLQAHQEAALEKLGNAAQEQQNYASAESAFLKAFELTHELGERVPRANEPELLYKLGVSAEGQAHWDDALDYYRRALLAFNELGDDERQRNTMARQLFVLERLGERAHADEEWASAGESYHRGLLLAQHLNDRGGQSRLLSKLGLVAAEQELWDQASGYFQQALGFMGAEADNDARLELMGRQEVALEKVGDVAQAQENWDAAESAYQQSLALAQELPDLPHEARVRMKLGNVTEAQERWEDALAHHQRALDLVNHLQLTGAQATASENYSRAQRGYKTALAAQQQTRGDAARTAQRWDEAESTYHDSLALAEELGDTSNEAELLYKLGLLSEDREHYLDALTYYRQALPLFMQHSLRDRQVAVMWNIGRAQRGAKRHAAADALAQGDKARQEKRFADADTAYERSLTLTQELADRNQEGALLYRLGQLAADQENWNEALNYYQQALPFYESPEQAETRLAITRAQADAVAKLGDELRRARNWEQAEAAYRYSLAVASSVDDRAKQGELLNTIGLLYADQEKWLEATQYYQDAVAALDLPEFEEQRREATRNQASAFASLGDASREEQAFAPAESAYRETLSLAQMLGDRSYEADIFVKLGALAEAQGLWDEALGHFDRALETYRELNASDAAAATTESIERTRRAQKHEAALAAVNRGDAAHKAQWWDEAVEHYELALPLFAELNLPADHAAVTERIEQSGRAKTNAAAMDALSRGDVAHDSAQWDEAVEHYQVARDLFNQLNLSSEQAMVADRIEQARRGKTNAAATEALARGDDALRAEAWDKAVEHYQTAQNFYHELDLPDEEAEAAARIEETRRAEKQKAADEALARGDVAHSAEQWDEAVNHYQTALGHYEQLRLPDAQAIASDRIEQTRRAEQLKLGNGALERGEKARAAQRWDEAVAEYQQAVDIFAGLNLPDRVADLTYRIEDTHYTRIHQAADAELAQADASHTAGQWDEAVAHYEAARQLLSELNVPAEQAAISDKIKLTHFAKNRQEADAELAQGDAAHSAEQWDAAVQHYQAALEFLSQLNVPDERAVVSDKIEQTRRDEQLKLGNEAKTRGDEAYGNQAWDEAVEQYQHALAIFAGLNMPDRVAEAAQLIEQTRITDIHQAADAELAQGDAARNERAWDEAVEHYHAALQLLNQLDVPDEQAALAARTKETERDIIHAAADDALGRGDEAFAAQQWDEAADHYREALARLTELDLPDQETAVASKIEQSQRAKKLQAANDAVGHAEAARDSLRWDEAVEEFAAALNLFAELNLADEHATVLAKIETLQRIKKHHAANAELALGDAAHSEQAWDDAVAHYQAALELLGELDLPAEEAAVSDKIVQTRRDEQLQLANAVLARADELRAAEQWDAAVEHYQQALGRFAGLNLPDRVADLTFRIQDTHYTRIHQAADAELAQGEAARTGELWDEAVAHYQAAQQLLAELNAHGEQETISVKIEQTRQDEKLKLATAALARGDAAHSSDQWDEAVEHYWQARAIFENLNLANDQAAVASKIEQAQRAKKYRAASESMTRGDEAHSAQQWNDAVASYRTARDIFADLGLDDEQASAWARIEQTRRDEKLKRANEALARGTFAHNWKQWNQATNYYHQALDLFTALNLPIDASLVLNKIEQAHWEKHQQAASDALQQAEAARGDQRWDDAIAHYQVALDHYAQLNLAKEQAATQNKIHESLRMQKQQAAQQAVARGDAAQSELNWSEAIREYEQASDLFTELGLMDEQAAMAQKIEHAQLEAKRAAAMETLTRGDTARGAQNWQEAEAAYQEGLVLVRELGEPNKEAEVLEKIGDTLRGARRWNEAESSYRSSLAMAQSLQDRRREGHVLNKLGLLAADQENWDEAGDLYRQALKTFKEIQLHGPQTDVWRNISEGVRGARRKAARDASALGDAKRQAKRWAEADDAYRYSLTLSEELGDLSSVGSRWNDLGLLAADQENWDTAQENFRRAIDIFGELDQRQAQASVWRNLASAHQRTRQWAEADMAYRRSLALSEQLGDQTNVAWRRNDLGLLAMEQGEWEIAQEHFERAFEIFQELGSRANQSAIWRNLVQAQANAQRESLELAQRQGDPGRQGQLLNDLGLLAEEQEQWTRALEYYQEALNVFEGNGMDSAALTVRRNIGDVQRARRRWQEAESAYQQNLSLAEQLGDRDSQAHLLGLLGMVAEGQAQWDRALPAHHAALAIFEELGDRGNQAAALEKMGDALRGAQRWSDAASSYRQSLELAQALGDRTREGHLYAKLGLLAADQEMWDEAREQYRDALNIFEQNDLPLNQANVLENMGSAEMGARNWDRALEYFQRAMELYGELDARRDRARAVMNLAHLSAAQRQWDQAASLFEQALELFSDIPDSYHHGVALNDLARLNIETSDLDQAQVFAGAALAIFQDHASRVQQTESLGILSIVAVGRGDWAEARRLLSQAIEINPRSWEARVQLAGVLIALDSINDAIRQCEACLGQQAQWDLAAELELAIARHFLRDRKEFKADLARAKTVWSNGANEHQIPGSFLAAASSVIAALEGNTTEALAGLDRFEQEPATAEFRDAYRFARLALLLISRSPQRITGRSKLIAYFKSAEGKRLEQRTPRRKTAYSVRKQSSQKGTPQRAAAEQMTADASEGIPTESENSEPEVNAAHLTLAGSSALAARNSDQALAEGIASQQTTAELMDSGNANESAETQSASSTLDASAAQEAEVESSASELTQSYATALDDQRESESDGF